ncbi:hypothetical protein RRG08_060462 [Elysia crispata]|uniref:Uncharacterized protein n=1 Tax=Elysia crispata TaxID=231223 RepID=A0AAE1B042_9GAST|nr:hypothetical protein RRG08_060462 [Elysia crispata]
MRTKRNFYSNEKKKRGGLQRKKLIGCHIDPNHQLEEQTDNQTGHGEKNRHFITSRGLVVTYISQASSPIHRSIPGWASGGPGFTQPPLSLESQGIARNDCDQVVCYRDRRRQVAT